MTDRPDVSETIRRFSAEVDGHYRIERELGAGGMATVYLAHDLKHDRDVAIKVLHPELAAALGGERFLSEIRTTARLQHPHILPLLDSGEAGGLLYYVMPFVAGETLRARLERERQLPVDDALRIAREVADALGAAHALGIIHRDIKPENILLQGGHALVADFGIALAVQEAGGQRMTQTGLSLGTPQYMSPEQAMGERAIDARTDIYALGAVLYEMLLGEPPFTGPTVQAIVAKVLTEKPAGIVARRERVSPTVEAAVLTALEKLPADRFSGALEFANALTHEPSPSARHLVGVAPAQRARPVVLTAAGAFVLGAAASAFVMLSRHEPSVTTGSIVHVTIDDGLEIQPAISPDGKVIAYAAGTSLHVRLFLRPVAGGRPVPLTNDSVSSQQNPQWSPSGASLLFLANGGVDTVAAGLGGGKPVTLISGTEGTVDAATWSSDGRRVAFVRRDSVLVYTIATGEKRFVANHAAKDCAWSPSGDYIACTTPRPFSRAGFNMGNTGPSKITVTSASGGEPIAVSDSVSLNISPVWSPDSRRLYFVSNRDGQRDIYYVAIGRDGHPSGEIRRLTTALNAVTLSLSRDGRRLAYSVYTPHGNIWSLPLLPTGFATSAMATQVTFGHQLVESMRVTPDGKTIIYDADRNGNSDIWRLTLGEREPEALTSDPVDEFGAVLSPDGRRLAFYSYPEGTGRGVIWVKSMDGGPAQRVNVNGNYGIWPEWTPDGKHVLWGCGRTTWCFASEESAGSWKIQQRDPATTRANWSPDGRWSTNPRRTLNSGQVNNLDTVWLYPRESGPRRMLFARRSASDPIPGDLHWSADSRAVYFRHPDPDGRLSFYALPIDGGPLRLVARLDDLSRPSYRPEFAVDARRIYFTINDRQSDISVVELIER